MHVATRGVAGQHEGGKHTVSTRTLALSPDTALPEDGHMDGRHSWGPGQLPVRRLDLWHRARP